MTTVLETPRLLFRQYEVSDADAAFEIYGDAVVMEFIGPKNVTASIEQQREKLIAIRAKHEALGEPFGAFALIERASGELVGTGLLKPLPDADGTNTEDIEIGWHLARRCWGRGLATEAGRAQNWTPCDRDCARPARDTRPRWSTLCVNRARAAIRRWSGGIERDTEMSCSQATEG